MQQNIAQLKQEKNFCSRVVDAFAQNFGAK
jgi:hypothetical protein